MIDSVAVFYKRVPTPLQKVGIHMATPIFMEKKSTFGLSAAVLAVAAMSVSLPCVHADKIFVGNDWGREIWMFDTETGADSRALFCNDTEGVNGLTFDRDGNLFESDFSSRSIVKFTPDGKRTTFTLLDSSGGGLAFDEHGNLFVPFQWGAKIEQVSPDGAVRTVIATNMGAPVVVAFDSSGTLFAADQKTGDIYKFNADKTRTVFAAGLKAPVGLVFDRRGMLFASSPGERKIFQFTPDGNRTEFATNIKAYTLAFDSNGNLFVTTGEEGGLYKFVSKNGKLSNQPELVDDGMGHDFFMAISPKALPYAELKLPPGVSLAVAIRDAAGNRVTNAAVFAGQDRYQSGFAKAKMTAPGNFHFKNLPPGENYLTAVAPGFAPEFRSVSLATNSSPTAIVLQPGRVIHGRVTNAAGEPVPDANVSYEGLAGRNGMFSGRTFEWKTKTNPNGEFTWDSAPAESVRLSITKNGYMALPWVTVSTATTNTADFTLNEPLTVKGLVTDADTGTAVAKFKIIPGWPQGGDQVWFERQRVQAGVNGQYQIRFDRPIVNSPTPMDFIFQCSAPGYAPVQSHAIKINEGTVTWDVKLKKTPATVGLVNTADGQPASGVKVFLATARDYLELDETSVKNNNRDSESYETDDSGHFAVPAQTEKFNLVAAVPAGFALVSSVEFATNRTLTLQPWSRIEGTLFNHGRPLPNRELYFFTGDGMQARNLWGKPVTVDAQGHFVISNAPPGTLHLNLKQPMTDNRWSYLELQTVVATAGVTNLIQVALNGRDVIGHWKRNVGLPADLNLEQGNLYLRPDLAPPPVPKDLDLPEKIQLWFENWASTAAGKKFAEAQRKMFQLQLKADGTVRGESVSPGKYTLSGNFWGDGTTIAEIENRPVVIPELATNDTDTPFDLGEIIIKPVKHLNIGDTALDFSVKTLDDQPLKLSDYHGKFVLLDFWATWCGPCVAETPHMKAAYEAYGTDSRFVMISLSLDQNTSLPKQFAQTHDIKWVQGYLGDWSKDTVTKDYNVRGIPSIFLIGPDGKIIAQNLRGEAIKSAIGSALGK